MARTIDRGTLREWMHQGQDFELVDTLPRAAYEQHHLPGAIHIVSDDIEAEAPWRLPERERTVVVYCGSTACQRSAKAAARLDALGYGDVREYVEGRQDWEAAGLPVESGNDPEEPHA
ncbi:rhodanese-like domain-containing protein [Halofilum ochraceum]|uniref:rhodanese-like domain-containing protein n=1 Tax=Halofilum ochraceum TaxID=1611323 RepID=UPI0008DA2105|nr:rhodanese-like domain-containing protein [Halofilum ochraceum]